MGAALGARLYGRKNYIPWASQRQNIEDEDIDWDII
jgi:hypothetical protein